MSERPALPEVESRVAKSSWELFAGLIGEAGSKQVWSVYARPVAYIGDPKFLKTPFINELHKKTPNNASSLFHSDSVGVSVGVRAREAAENPDSIATHMITQ